MSTASDKLFAALCSSHKLPAPMIEYRFHKTRRWRFDYAWPRWLLALEVEGGIFGKGKRCPVCGQRKALGHTSPKGIARDIAKYNEAALCGWRVLRVVPDQLCTDATIDMLGRALGWGLTVKERSAEP